MYLAILYLYYLVVVNFLCGEMKMPCESNTSVPVVGFCLGYKLVGHAFGAKLIHFGYVTQRYI